MKFGKNALIWIGILLVLTTFFGLSDSRNLRGGTENVAFSDFMNNVKEKKVSDVSINGGEIFGTTTDGKKFITYAPYSPTTVDTLVENDVKIDAKPQDSSTDIFWNILISENLAPD